jgi:hypothetical protein
MTNERTADMRAFDSLPRKVRAALRDLPIGVSARNVAESVRAFGVARTLEVLADIAANPPSPEGEAPNADALDDLIVLPDGT